MANVQLTVPKFGVSTESVRISEWLKEVEDEIQQGDPVVLVETDKATVEIEATVGGILAVQLVEVDTELSVGDPYAEVTPVRTAPETSADVVDQAASAPKTPAPETPASPASEVAHLDTPTATSERTPESVRDPASATPPDGTRGKTRATPSARALAKAHGLDLQEITGSGPAGRIRRDDVAQVAGVTSIKRASNGENGLWNYAVSVPMPALGEAGAGATTLGDLVVMAADLALGSASNTRWRAARLREEGASVLLEQRNLRDGGTPELWENIDPGVLLEDASELTIVVSELPGITFDIPGSGAATLTVTSPGVAGEALTIDLKFDPQVWDLGAAYGVLREVGRLLSSPADLAAALWVRARG